MKRIVICADGTWNLRDQVDDDTGKRRPTNVTKLARAVLPRGSAGIDQVVVYCDGVGTNRGMDKVTGGAFGRGIEDNVRDLYRSIVYNFVPGDQLFLFGFSRGAFTVRTLAGFMRFAGLVEKNDDYYVPDIYACYEQRQGQGAAAWERATRNVQGIRACPPIEMIGVWDTVGALGAPGVLGQLFNRKKYQYHDVGLNEFIRHAYQALAIDEKRKPFLPNMWEKTEEWSGVLEQVWFAGVHSNIGGGYSPDGLANTALHWMVGKAVALGLEVDAAYLQHFEAHSDSYLADSMTAAYRVIGSVDRPIGTASGGNEAVHASVLARLDRAELHYTPQNLKDALDRERVDCAMG